MQPKSNIMFLKISISYKGLIHDIKHKFHQHLMT
jgi:hypothetical protein